MPLHVTLSPLPHLHVVLWHLTEDVAGLLALWGDAGLSARYHEAVTDKRRREILATHLVMRHYYGGDIALSHRPDGSPYTDRGFISVSHTARYVAVAFSSHGRVGVDVEMIGRKAPRAAVRFLQPAELEQLPADARDEAAHICWAAKEVAYKLYPDEEADFSQAITLSPVVQMPHGSLTARIGHNEPHIITVCYSLCDEYVLAYAQEPA